MATIRWNKKARHLFQEHVLYAWVEFGKETASRWYRQKTKIEDNLRKFPESYNPEPLVVKSHIYRSAIIMKRFKLVYFYIPSSDTVRIVDIWDMRMNPASLKKRIK